MIPNEFKGRFAYHFTSVNNLQSIISDGLLCTNLKIKHGIVHEDIANNDIQKRRSKMEVTCGPRGVVHDYVPFYFAK
ncbi:DarT ssDNA thymidine ADP-ribosyltransferase family protein, partial [Vibrio cyclitrophicus]